MAGSPLWIYREHVVLRRSDRMACVAAIRSAAEWSEIVRRCVVVELGIAPAVAPGKSLAVLHHQVDVVERVGHGRRSRRVGALLRLPVDLGHLRAIRKWLA